MSDYGPSLAQVNRGTEAIQRLWLTSDSPPTSTEMAEAVLRTLCPAALAVDATERLRHLLNGRYYREEIR